MLPSELEVFERRVLSLVEGGHITGPVHLSGGNEAQLIEIFRKYVQKKDWVFSTWRWHYHALLHGVPPEEILHHLRAKHTMNAAFPERRFYTSAIAGGILPIACGVAAGLQKEASNTWVHCFIGDMTAQMGIAREVAQYAEGKQLPLRIYVEDNGLSTDTPTQKAWGICSYSRKQEVYSYSRTYAHMQRSPKFTIRKVL